METKFADNKPIYITTFRSIPEYAAVWVGMDGLGKDVLPILRAH